MASRASLRSWSTGPTSSRRHPPARPGWPLLARRIKGLAHIVFVTAYDAHAIEAFNQGAVDYLLKPLADERLRDTVQRLQQRLQLPPAELARWLQQWCHRPSNPRRPASPRPALAARFLAGERLHLIMVADVSHFRSDNKYTCAVTREGEFLAAPLLRELLAQLDPEQFWQIHRAVVINPRTWPVWNGA